MVARRAMFTRSSRSAVVRPSIAPSTATRMSRISAKVPAISREVMKRRKSMPSSGWALSRKTK